MHQTSFGLRIEAYNRNYIATLFQVVCTVRKHVLIKVLYFETFSEHQDSIMLPQNLNSSVGQSSKCLIIITRPLSLAAMSDHKIGNAAHSGVSEVFLFTKSLKWKK